MLKQVNEIATIDVKLVSIVTKNPTTGNPDKEYAIQTASKISVEAVLDTQEAVTLVLDGVLKAQKPEKKTLTGNTITMTNSVFSPEVVQIIQGGTITYDVDEPTKIRKYTPPLAGESVKGTVFELKAYSTIFDAAGLVVGYEVITYPNCQGSPIANASENNVFRVSEYVITSAPKKGEPGYTIDYIDPDGLPEISAA